MPPWAAYPGAPTPAQLSLEAFGRLSRDTTSPGVVTDDEDLYSVFRTRSELMSWSSFEPGAPRLWSLEEAEVTANSEGSRIGWVQVGVDGGRPLTMLPALAQCFDDALRRFGSVEVSSVQLTCRHLQSGVEPWPVKLISAHNWFNISGQTRAEALLAFDTGLGASHAEALRAAERLPGMNTGPFEFGSPVPTPPHLSIQVPAEAEPVRLDNPPLGQPSSIALPVTLPEWTASAMGWVLALVIETARAQNPSARNFTVQIARVENLSGV